MKTRSIAEARANLTELLADPEPLALTDSQGSEPAWIVIRVKDGGERPMFYPVGDFVVLVLSKRLMSGNQETGDAQSAGGQFAAVPVFGSGKGTLTVNSEDDEHLEDFREYME